MDNAERNQATLRVVAITCVCLLAVVGNLLIPSCFWDINGPGRVLEKLAFAACGALVAEVCLLGIWCGLSQQPIKYRLPVTAALVLVVACSYSLGLQLPDAGKPGQGMPLEVALVIAGAGFGMFALIQIPLWLIRRWTRYRISTLESAPVEDSPQGRQFSVGYAGINVIFGWQDAEEVLVGVTCFEIGLAGATLAALLVLRSLGYRLLVVG